MRTGKLLGVTAAAVGLAALPGVGGAFGGAAQAQTKHSTLKTITWTNPPAVEAFKKINAEFHEKYPNITVRFQTAANVTAGYATLLETMVDSSGADVVSTINQVQPMPLKPTRTTMTPTQYWTTSNVFESLSGQPWLSNLGSLAVQSETYKGKVYGMLTGVYQEMIFYNKADFAKYHLSVPHTYTEFIALLKKEKADHLVPLWLGVGGGAQGYLTRFLLEPLMYELWAPKVPGQTLATAIEKGVVSWNSPEFVQALTEEATIAQYLEPGWTGVSWEGMPGALAANKSPMLLDGSWDLASVQKANPGIQIGAFPLPGSNDASRNEAVANPDLVLCVLSKAPNKEAALKWMAFFASPAIYQQYVDITGISPTETGGTYDSFSSKSLGALFGKGFDPSTVMPILGVNQGYWDTPTQFPLLQEQVMTGAKTPQQAAALYAKDWKKS